MKPTIIIGGGVVGLFTAYFLQKEGVEVTVIDQSDLNQNCSTGNAGMITPSHIIPLAAPGMISKGMAWMFSSKSPFYIHPRLDYKLLRWCMLFFKATSQSQVDRSIPYLNQITLFSKSLFQEFEAEHPDSSVFLSKKGLVMIYQTEAVEKEEIELAHLARQFGLEAEILNSKEVQALEPNLEVKSRGGIFFPGDSHLDPAGLFNYLKKYLTEKGVKILPNTQVLGFEKSSNKIEAVLTDKGKLEGGKVILAAGAWSAELAKQLGFSLPLMGGKGYSFIQENQPAIQLPTILTERKVAVSPYGDYIRFGGTLEVAGTNQKINMNRVKGIFESINQYYPDFKANFPDEKDIWKGLRPCSPDGLPYIGYAPGYENVLVGSGHAMLGVTMGPATGKLLTELHQKKPSSIEIKGFEVSRYN
ncbi:D-amino-acid dehydrogenase [Algoriphagus boseongensis]|uniref:D-amino-acid dehydrogenase n=1 Tax=Algoriphagus boseongensis TaxID=1442587 RepID=A0A4R6T7C6_9BACT|nr:FAD-dependent oxidoreductase [Algoriphagus boseongensis]TDQ17476.1 D-amino-acid dehydrogenase [Algoriphagus boseongensis]